MIGPCRHCGAQAYGHVRRDGQDAEAHWMCNTWRDEETGEEHRSALCETREVERSASKMEQVDLVQSPDQSERREARTHIERQRIIAVDFDGTLAENDYPDIGEPITPVIDALRAEVARGAKVILWTCRTGHELLMALAWLDRYGIVPDAVNQNLPETLLWLQRDGGAASPKVYATEYWDDRAVNPVGDRQ